MMSKTICNITKIDIHSNELIVKVENLIPDFCWLENVNKHLPNIISLRKKSTYIYSLSLDELRNYCAIQTQNITFKLSFSDFQQRIEYKYSGKKIKQKLSDNIQCLWINDIFIIKYKNYKKLSSSAKVELLKVIPSNLTSVKNRNKILNLVVIGTCFSRSVFISDDYFNPSYKKYFSVKYTAFHSSMVSLMSTAISDSTYKTTLDLTNSKIFSYVEMEFKKNLVDIIENTKCDFIFMDNYIEAIRPLIEIGPCQFITYNKYFSESIYKRKFSGCKVIYPGTAEYYELYRNAVVKFNKQLFSMHRSPVVILLGGRLSKTKFNKQTNIKESWDDEMDWIIQSNKNWDCIDEIFVKEIPTTKYIDMRTTIWKSDVDSPLIGGASPSHYQSEYYKEIFEILKKIFLRN